jgi:hypothetical protein
VDEVEEGEKTRKQKIAAPAVIFIRKEKGGLRFGLGHGANAAGAQHFLDPAVALIDGHLLQVRFESAVGGAHRERPVMAKRCRFSAMGTLSHLIGSFLAIIPEFERLLASTAFYHTTHPSTSQVVN